MYNISTGATIQINYNISIYNHAARNFGVAVYNPIYNPEGDATNLPQLAAEIYGRLYSVDHFNPVLRKSVSRTMTIKPSGRVM